MDLRRSPTEKCCEAGRDICAFRKTRPRDSVELRAWWGGGHWRPPHRQVEVAQGPHFQQNKQKTRLLLRRENELRRDATCKINRRRDAKKRGDNLQNKITHPFHPKKHPAQRAECPGAEGASLEQLRKWLHCASHFGETIRKIFGARRPENITQPAVI